MMFLVHAFFVEGESVVHVPTFYVKVADVLTLSESAEAIARVRAEHVIFSGRLKPGSEFNSKGLQIRVEEV